MKDDEEEWERPRSRIVISFTARRFIRERGGAVYVWGKPAGHDSIWLEATLGRPPEIEFGHRRDGDVNVFLQEGIRLPALRVGLRLFPHRKLVAGWPLD